MASVSVPRPSIASRALTARLSRAFRRLVVPLEAITARIGTTVSAAPAPKPAAVRPTASPRRSGNHFTA